MFFCLYHGKTLYPYSTDYYEQFLHPDLSQTEHLNMHLIDLNTFSSKKYLSYGPLSLILYLLNCSGGSKNYLSAIKSAKKLGMVKSLEKVPISHDFISLINIYLYIVVREENIDEILKEFKVTPKIHKQFMEYIQQVRSKWMERGREEGREEGLFLGMEKGKKEGPFLGMEKGKKEEKLAIAQALFKQGIDIKIIESVTGLSRKDILDLRAQC